MQWGELYDKDPVLGESKSFVLGIKPEEFPKHSTVLQFVRSNPVKARTYNTL